MAQVRGVQGYGHVARRVAYVRRRAARPRCVCPAGLASGSGRPPLPLSIVTTRSGYAPAGTEAAAQGKILVGSNSPTPSSKLILRFGHGKATMERSQLTPGIARRSVTARPPRVQRASHVPGRHVLRGREVDHVQSVRLVPRPARPATGTRLQNLENELNILGTADGGKGAVFGRDAVDALKKRCKI